MSSNIQDVIARLLGQPSSIFGGGMPDHGLSDPNVASPPEDFIASPNPGQPLPPEQRMEGWRRVATDFTYGLGSGLSAGSQNPTGRALRTSAGAGAILQQPTVLQKAREAMALQKQQEDARKAQILAGILGQQQQQAQQAKEHADAFGLQQKTFELNKSNIEADNALAAKNADAKKLQDAEENRQKQEKEAQFYQTPLNASKPVVLGDGEYYAYPNPQGGDPILRKVGDAAPKKVDHDTVETAEGVKQWNPKTNLYDIKVGNVKATSSATRDAQSYADLTPKDKARVDAVASKVASGEYTPSVGLAALGGVRGGLGGALTESLADDLVLPQAVRTQNADIERAKNLLIPVHDLIDKINETSDLSQKAILSARLDNYVSAIGTQFARAKGERGVVTDQDVNRVLGLIPGWKSANFAPQYAKDNLALVEEAFDRDQKALLGKYFTKFQQGGTEAPAPSKKNPFK